MANLMNWYNQYDVKIRNEITLSGNKMIRKARILIKAIWFIGPNKKILLNGSKQVINILLRSCLMRDKEDIFSVFEIASL